MKYAVIKTGGKQYRVAPSVETNDGREHAVETEDGDELAVSAQAVLDVERLDGEVGGIVRFDQVLMVSNGDIIIGNPFVADCYVEAIILAQLRDEKKIVLKKRRRKNSRRRKGHRQLLTRIQITSIVKNQGLGK